ncbi:MAG: RNA polymerase-binding protein DksA [Coxiella sp. RIFCSPHIGHO2_12_FULL_42_15]|nr:MAG: RNA polymerase-binding protein DksA [Coxiella sp. RIFCSPHIGHO2_12_FULL_42_15]
MSAMMEDTIGNDSNKIKPYKAKKNESYMSKEMQAHFRNILTELKRQIMSTSDHTISHMKNEREQYADELDLAAQEEAFRLELRERDRERKLLKNVERSLDNLDNGEYGFCVECGSEIGLKRLEARPTATMCIDCKSFAELKEKRTSGK